MVYLSDLVQKLGGSCSIAEAGASINDVKIDSRQVGVGDLFAALPGKTVDGSRYIAEAAARGAVAVLTPHELDLRTVNLDMPGLYMAQWTHPGARKIVGSAAALVHGEPARGLRIAGVTGPNGKTTTAHILGHLLDYAGMRPAVLGTAGNRLSDGVVRNSRYTTPDATELQRLFRQHREGGGETLVMEVSSHALVQDRTAGLDFGIGIFTNLTREHLDYHGDMGRYAQAKAKLFSQLGPHSAAVLNIDDPAWAAMARAAQEAGARVVTYSVRSRADLSAAQLRTGLGGTSFALDGMGIKSTELNLSLRGRYNVENALAAGAAALLMGASPSAVVEGLATTPCAPGRLEVIPTGERGFHVYVDYAHSPDALERVLKGLRHDLDEAAQGGRLIALFGCGGDRDPGKRPLMGQVVGNLADVAVVTSDNPRSEDPDEIAAAILGGMKSSRAKQVIEIDRKSAIEAAIGMARPGDVVLVAGKGHETRQVIGDEVVVFDDRMVAREVLA